MRWWRVVWMTWAVVSGPPREALARAPAKAVKVDRVDARGCGEVVVAGEAVQGAAPGLCVVQALWAPLEGGVVALLVRAPHRFEEEERLRVFVYRLEGRRLVPRFLGSGFASREVRRLVALDDALGVEVFTDGGVSVLRCRFDGFPLVCRDGVGGGSSDAGGWRPGGRSAGGGGSGWGGGGVGGGGT